MATRALLFCLLLTALAVSGCAGTPAPSSASSSAAAAPAAPLAQPTTTTVLATRSVVATPVHIEGRTSTGGCVYAAGEGACNYQNGKQSFVVLDTKGSPERLAGNLTWTATTPNSQEMSIYVLYLKDGTYWYDSEEPVIATGPAPLSFDFDLGRYANTTVAFGVSNVQGEGALVGWASAGTSQDFVVDATFATLVLTAA